MRANYKRSTAFNKKWPVRIKKFIKTVGCEIIPRHKIIWCAPARFSPGVALTFDDGPNPETTPQLLDVLDEYGVKATFFLIGQRASANRDLIARMQQSGHQIGEHSYAHESLHSLNFSQLNDDVIACNECLSSAGITATAYRPPFGEFRWSQLRLFERLGKTVALWNVDSRDFEAGSPQEVLRNIDVDRLKPGDVVLLHEGYTNTIAAIKELIPKMLQKGLQIVTLQQLIDTQPKHISHGSK